MPRKPGKTKAEDTQAAQDRFLEAFGQLGTVRAALGIANISRSAISRWSSKDMYGFKERYAVAKAIFKESLIDIGLKRIREQEANANPVLLLSYLNAYAPEYFRRDSRGADSVAKEFMVEMKRWRKEQAKSQKSSEKKVASEEQAVSEDRKNAIDQVEKILSLKKSSDDSKS